MPTSIEREKCKAETRQRGRQKARRADVEIHCVTVKIKHTARGRAAIRLVIETVERLGRCRNRNELEAHAACFRGNGMAGRIIVFE
jgi:hypothetical protein